MTLRDIDLVIAAIVMAIATALSRAADPDLAIVVLAVVISVGVLWLGEERIAYVWREYCREPAPKPDARKRRPLGPLPRSRPPRGSTRAAGLAKARLVAPGDRSYIRFEDA